MSGRRFGSFAQALIRTALLDAIGPVDASWPAAAVVTVMPSVVLFAVLLGVSYLRVRVMRKRSPGMKTRSYTIGVPSGPTDTRSERKAARPGRQPSSRAARRSSGTAETVSRAAVISIPSLKVSTWRRGVTQVEARDFRTQRGGQVRGLEAHRLA